MIKFIKFLTIISVLIVAFFIVAMYLFDLGPSRQMTQSNQPVKALNYVALGDSLAVGYTPKGTTDKGYPYFIAEKLKGEGRLGNYQNFGVTGYTTKDVLKRIDQANTANAEVVNAISNADIITFDIGANDILSAIPALAKNPTQLGSTVKNVAGNIEKIIHTLKGINPKAKIYVMGYYDAFPYRTEVEHTLLVSLIKVFNQAIQNAATNTDSIYVNTFNAMDKNLKEYLPKDDIHPNLSGYEALGNEFWILIKGNF
jgi:lysophospholipase L1-like esterase